MENIKWLYSGMSTKCLIVFVGNNLLLKLLYEASDRTQEEYNLHQIYDIEAFWRFRHRISLQHLTHELNEHVMANQDEGGTHHVLHRFLQMVSTTE